MTQERRKQIEEFAKEVGLSFASAKMMLEEIEQDIDTEESMREMMF